jgi:hypothetical protein
LFLAQRIHGWLLLQPETVTLFAPTASSEFLRKPRRLSWDSQLD